MATYQSVILAKRPGKGEIVPGETFKIEEHKRLEESDLKDGQLLLEVVYLSLDPSMRGWLNGEWCCRTRMMQRGLFGPVAGDFFRLVEGKCCYGYDGADLQ